MTPETVADLYAGITPEFVPDFYKGDSSIPGVSELAPRKPLRWIVEYGSLDQVITTLEEVKGKVEKPSRPY